MSTALESSILLVILPVLPTLGRAELYRHGRMRTVREVSAMADPASELED